MKLLPLLLTFLLAFSATPRAEEAPPATQVTAQKVTPDETQKLLQEKPGIIVLDVRTPEEFQAGHIAGAQNVDFMSAEWKQKVAELDKSKTYVVHCASGSRSSRAVTQMEKQEFLHLYHLNSGMKGSESAGKPVEK